MSKKIFHSVNKVKVDGTPLEKGGKIRVNKMNQPEKISQITTPTGKKKKKSTLNELSNDILEMLEDVEMGTSSPAGSAVMADEPTFSRMTNQRRPPSYTASRGENVRNAGDTISNFTVSARPAPNIDVASTKANTSTIRGRDRRSNVIDTSFGDGLDYAATHNEDFTGTGAIGISPGGYSVSGNTIEPKKKKKGLKGFTNVIQMDSHFRRYLENNNIVETNGFNEYLRANNVKTTVTESGLVKLMERDRSNLFHMGTNNRGRFWFKESI